MVELLEIEFLSNVYHIVKANNVATPPTLGEFMLSVETKPEDKVFDYIFKK